MFLVKLKNLKNDFFFVKKNKNVENLIFFIYFIKNISIFFIYFDFIVILKYFFLAKLPSKMRKIKNPIFFVKFDGAEKVHSKKTEKNNISKIYLFFCDFYYLFF